MKAKEIILDELEEQAYEEKVEDVIFWALEAYAKTDPKNTFGRLIASTIVERIKEEEQKTPNYGTN